MELELESELSRGPALEDHDTTALTKEQQERLIHHKVLKYLGRQREGIALALPQSVIDCILCSSLLEL